MNKMQKILFFCILAIYYGVECKIASTPRIMRITEDGQVLAKSFYYDDRETGLLPWFEAMEWCQINGLEPGRVESQMENDMVANLLNSEFQTSHVFWLGASDWGQDGVFYWIRTGQNLTFSNFAATYPNGGPAESCIYVWGDGLWYDQYCQTEDVRPLCQIVT